MILTGNILFILGALVFATAALGVFRFPDAYTRISAIGTAGGVGIVLVVTGAFFHDPGVGNLIMLLIIIVLQLCSSAVGSIAIARSAYITGTTVEWCHYDELADDESAVDRA